MKQARAFVGEQPSASVLVGSVGLSDARGNLLVPLPAIWHLFEEQWRRALLVLAKHRQADWYLPWRELPGCVRAAIQANLMQAIDDGLGTPSGARSCDGAAKRSEKTAPRFPPVRF